ncbi:Uma2 family endonuclease [Nocardia asteroides]|uniref:Uma2 family endonuclease n=1 Tax=Nocardia asteroides TaxID=1824 RepID=UPI001E518ABC|nr:Uma2 family endonuclease [Nocardia asteroides]UGT63783.1 Uma2 family endonuclease [Nocardia asteroides]
MTTSQVNGVYHQVAARLCNALNRCARESAAEYHFVADGNVVRGEASPFDARRDSPAGTLMAGKILSVYSDREVGRSRYSGAGTPWYWEVTLSSTGNAVAAVHAHALETGHGQLPHGVRPLRPANYLVVGEWTAEDEDGIRTAFPFPIEIPWSELDPDV